MLTKMPSFWALAQCATKWIPVCKLLQLPKLPEAWLTLFSSVYMFQLISTIMPLRQQGPQLLYFRVVLLTPWSCHSLAQLWGTTAQEPTFMSANSFLGRVRTYISDARLCAKSGRVLFHNRNPSLNNGHEALSTHPPPTPKHTRPTFSTSIWCLKNHYYRTVMHPSHVFACWSRAWVHTHQTPQL